MAAAKTAPKDSIGGLLGAVGRDRGDGGGWGVLDELGEPLDDAAALGHHQQLAAGRERASLLSGVGAFDAGPRLEQSHRGRAGLFAHGDEEAFVCLGVDDDALVHEHVLLQRALEVVAEGGVGGGGEHVAIVGLHQGPVADLVALHLRADRHHAGTGLVAGHGRGVTGHVAGDRRQLVRTQEREHLALARVRGEGMQQLGVAEADAGGLDLAQDLGGTRHRHRLGGVERDLVGGHDLDRVLRLGDIGHESITWPPVTGNACPVSYCCATR